MNDEIAEITNLVEGLQLDSELATSDLKSLTTAIRQVQLRQTRLESDLAKLSRMVTGIAEGLAQGGAFEKTPNGYAVSIDSGKFAGQITEDQ